MTVRLDRVLGAAVTEVLPALAALRIAVFREYPYLYDGTLAYETQYLASYARSPESLVVLARDGDRVVGASTAMPLALHDEAATVRPPLEAAGYHPARVFYFGESVLDPAYRGHGLGRAFFEHREAHARASGYQIAAFCAVERPPEHPAQPADYRSPATLWQRSGFVRRPDITTTFAWRDLGDAAETPKPMVFWIKELA